MGDPQESQKADLRCPRCGAEPPADAGVDAVCEEDGYAFVTEEAMEEAGEDPFLGLTIADRYVVYRRLGAGSMGTVYRARQASMGRDVALKILRSDRAFDSQAKARFQREARAMSLLTSPHTVTVFDFGETPDPKWSDEEFDEPMTSLFLAMELLEGEPLGKRIKRKGRLDATSSISFTKDALRSLAEAHQKGVIHRDLKPDNLLLVDDPNEGREICKVLDFGIAKVVGEPTGVDALETQAGTVFGTPRYMSPEQAQAKPLDARSDLYSLGVLLYQMLVGRPPFVDDDAVVVMAHHIKTAPVPPDEAAPSAGIPRSVTRLVMRVLSKDPDDRPASAKDLIEELEEAERLAEEEGDARDAATAELSALTADAQTSGAALGRKVIAVGASALVTAAIGWGLFGETDSPRAPLEAKRGVQAAALRAFSAVVGAVQVADGGGPTPASVAPQDPETPPEDAVAAEGAGGKPADAPTAPLNKRPYERFQ